MISGEYRDKLCYNIEWDQDMQPIYEEDKESFLNWFCTNASIYEVSADHENIIVKDNIIETNRCFGNSQYIANKYKKQYAEGYIMGGYGKYIPHGFNIVDDKIEDYTLSKLSNYTLPSVYWGIEIPQKYFTNDCYSENGNRSLIMTYFNDCKNGIKTQTHI